MGSRVVMPKLTDTMEEGVVVKWKKQEGEAVAAGDVLAEIETDKAVMDLEAFASGVLRRVLASEGETVKAGALIGVIGEPDEDISPLLSEQASEAGKPAAGPSPGDKRAPSPPEPAKTREAAPPKAEIKASPRARTLARERGIDLNTVAGSGPDGRIVEEDIAKATPARAKPPGHAVEQPLSQMRKAIARTTTQSKGPVPHFYVTTDIDMEEADRFRHQFRQLRPNPPGVNDLIVKAAALALLRHPEINASFAGEAIRRHASIDIGIAVGLDEGLISPVLRDCGSKSLLEIAEQAHVLITRARNRQLRPEEYSDATFSISNLGMFDVENFIAILMPPEAAALAVGSIREVPVADSGRVRVGRQMKVTLSCDHRVIDGIQAAKFLKEFKRILEHPLELVLPQEGEPGT
jgi:pyruvate dehydrogenase E2 component (dihydrolipoamide acetyltransferase)